MDWRPLEGERGEEARAVGASLAELGFPEDILADMSDEDILACEGGVRGLYRARLPQRAPERIGL